MGQRVTHWWTRRGLVVTIALVGHGLAVPLAGTAGQTDRERAGLRGPAQTVSRGGFSEAPFGVSEGGRTVSTYDLQGNETETAYYNPPAGGGSLFQRAVTTYDAQARKTQTALYERDGSLRYTIFYTYDPQGLLREQISCDAQGCFDKVTYQYDAQENLREEIAYSVDGASIRSRFVYTYDARGHRIETTTYDAHDDGFGHEWKTVETYNPQGDVSERTTYFTRKAGDPSAEEEQEIPSPSKQVYTYEYDARGNWLKQTLFQCEPTCRQLSVTTRTLTYYEEGKK